MRLRRIEPVLRHALRGPCLLPPGSRLLVAVSGGADSTALLVALASVAREFGLSLAAAHLHHGLRGREADADLEHVRGLCRRLGVPLEAARWDTRSRMRREGLSGEGGLRTLRRRFLAAARARAGAAAIATAHTADDQLETLLMRLARGTGLAGLGGMRPRRGAWLKPLLGATREDITRDLRGAGVSWREDASNRERDAFRNRVRLDVVPALAAALSPGAGPAARAGLARRAEAAAAEARDARRVVERLAGRTRARAGTRMDTGVLARAPRAVRLAALRRWWADRTGGRDGLTRPHREMLLRLVAGHGDGEVGLPGGWTARRRSGSLALVPPARGRVRETRPESRAGGRRAAAGTPRAGDGILQPSRTTRAKRARRALAAAPARRSTPAPTRPAASRLERHD
jgi:tRNA(Ile)-lysidine synthase